MFVESMDPTFTAKDDIMPKGTFGTRTKYIHSVGVVGKVRFITDDKCPFNGIWEEADHGLIRLSSAA